MRRRAFIAFLGGATVAPLLRPLPLRAQQPAMPVIGLLTAANQSDDQLRTLQKGLSEGGYVEGRNLAIIYRSADNQYDRLPALAADLVARQVSVILALGSPVPARAAMAATKTIPIVFAYGGDPVSDTLVASLNRPGGNVTGVTMLAATLTAKLLELLREITPQVTDVALLVNPNNAQAEIQIKDAGAAAHILGQRLHVVNANSEGEFDAAFASIRQLKAGALLVGADSGFTLHRDQLAALAARYKIPAMYPNRDYPVAGGLMSYGASMTDTWRQAGVYAGRILKGAKPADLPVVQPTKFELVINLKAAKALGLTVPNTLLVSAVEVIE
jgi:putative ABC transport system substrate-binding protein